ncbi:MAG: DNA polymerase III subunit gamma/tau [Pseudomonadota bacterium]|nr:DNA polymerase III subunit gamma/tau [Pseudomonadota bacterium]
MNNDVLALKYRPKFFDEVVGQDFVVKTLSNSITLEKIHNSYLFSGTRGVGKTTIARIFAKSLLCEKGILVKPCGECSSCTQIDNGTHLDLIEIDAASRTKVEDTQTLMENVQYSPTSSRFKVYLIDEVHMLSNKSFNALLKTIEEPPAHVKFLLATTEPEKLPETVLSRCLHFKLSTVDVGTIESHIKKILEKEGIKSDNESINLISATAKGSIRDGLSLLEQCVAYCENELDGEKIKFLLGEIDDQIIKDLIINIISKNPDKLVQTIQKIKENINFEKVIDLIINIFYKITLFKIKSDFIENDSSHKNFIEEQAKLIDEKELQLFYQIAISSKKDFKFSENKKDYLTMILLRMVFFSNSFRNNAQEDPEETITDNKVEVEESLMNQASNSSEKEETNGFLEMNDKGTKNKKEEKLLWEDLLMKLDISGLSLNLAKNSLLTNIQKDSAILKIPTKKKNIYPKSCVSDLIAKINKYFNRELSINIEYEENLLSPEIKEVKKQENDAIKALEAAESDTSIDSIKKYFDAEIDKNSIKKINN